MAAMDESCILVPSPIAALIRDTVFGRAVRSLFHWQTLDYEEEHGRAFAESYYLRKKFLRSIRGREQFPGFDPENIVQTESLEVTDYHKNDNGYVVNFFDPKDPEVSSTYLISKLSLI